MAGDLTSGRGLLTLLFTEAVAMIVFHGTPVGSWLMGAVGLHHGID